MSYPSPAHALAAIAKELGADGLQFDETGLARINIGKNVVVAFGQGVRSDCLDFLAEIPLKMEELSKESACQLLLQHLGHFASGGRVIQIQPHIRADAALFEQGQRLA